jgi:hypothetical protein
LFIANNVANAFDGGTSTASSHNRISYATDTAGVTVNLVNGTGSGGLAAGDTYTNIQDATGGSGNDTFVASAAANNFDGGTGGVDTVSYTSATAGVTANLQTGVGSAGFANGDTYTHIANLIGSGFADVLTGQAGGGSTLTGGAGGDTLTGIGTNNTASYAGSAAVQVDLFYTDGTNTSGGHAAGDKLINIQNLVGSSNNDVFFASLDANVFTGGGSNTTASATTGAGGDTVSYFHSTSAVTVSLSANTASGGIAAGDSFSGITNLVGSNYDDFLTGLAAGGSTLTGGAGADTLTGLGTNNTVTYVGSSAGVNVDLYTGAGTVANTGGDAQGDILSNIQHIIGSSNNDLFYASSDANKFIGGGGVDTVSYLHSNAAVTVNLNTGTGSGGFAAGDTYSVIQNATGSAYDDTFVANNVANAFNGGSGGTDTVDYSASGTTAVTVDLFHGTGSGGYAAGDTYTGIENVIGSGGDDLMYASGLANAFNGGAGTDTVSYRYSSGTAVVADLVNGGTGGDASGDTYTAIENLTGSENVDSTLTGNTSNNILTALGSTTTNTLMGGGGNDTFDGIAGAHNTMVGGAGNDIFKITANGATSNSTSITSGGGSDTLEVHGAGTSVSAAAFSNTVHGGIQTLDLSQGSWSTVQFSYADVANLTTGGTTLTVKLNNNEGFQIAADPTNTSDHFVYFGGTSEYAFYNSSNVELARVHLTYV